MSEITPYGDDEMSEHGLRIRCKDLRGRIQELEAQLKRSEEHTFAMEEEFESKCAAMREALEMLPRPEFADGSYETLMLNRAAAALATDAGKAMLERHQQERGARSDAFDDMEQQMFATKERAEKAERERDDAMAACQQKHGVHYSWVTAAIKTGGGT